MKIVSSSAAAGASFLLSLLTASNQLTLLGALEDGDNSTMTMDDGSNSTNGTSAPSQSPPPPPPNDCDKIEIGSIYFLFLNSVDPDEVAFFLFEDLPGNLELLVTDNAWNGVEFQTDEGTLSYTTPSGGLAGGTYFGFGPGVPQGDKWEPVDGSFSLSPEGEQIFLYCYSAFGFERPLTAISYNGPFQEPGLENYAFNESALPTALLDNNGAIVLEHKEYWVYAGPQRLEKEELKKAILDTNNWKGGDGRSTFGGSGAAAYFTAKSAAGIWFFTTALWSVFSYYGL